MASSTLATYYDATNHTDFALVTTGATGGKWAVAGRSLSEPYSLEIQRKIGPAGALANDHIVLRLIRTDKNATTGKPATYSITMDISVPKDNSILTETVQKYILKQFGSVINDCAAMVGTYTNAVALLEGRDL